MKWSVPLFSPFSESKNICRQPYIIVLELWNRQKRQKMTIPFVSQQPTLKFTSECLCVNFIIFLSCKNMKFSHIYVNAILFMKFQFIWFRSVHICENCKSAVFLCKSAVCFFFFFVFSSCTLYFQVFYKKTCQSISRWLTMQNHQMFPNTNIQHSISLENVQT